MNCKPGDLAVVVIAGSNTRNNLGRILKVLRRAPDGTLIPGVPHDTRIRWVYEPPMKTEEGWNVRWVNDCSLRPIRPDGITTEEVKELFSPSPAKESEKV